MKLSCGIIPFRENKDNKLEFFVGHSGGNYNKGKNLWMFLKGSVEENETWVDTAIREFKEETGLLMSDLNVSSLIPLGSIQQSPHKVVVAFGLHYPNIDPSKCFSNMVEGGNVPEIDRYMWMTYEDVCKYTHRSHIYFYDQLNEFHKKQ